jgi:hypothetical protein
MQNNSSKLDFQKVEKKLQLAAGLFAFAFQTKRFQIRKKIRNSPSVRSIIAPTL